MKKIIAIVLVASIGFNSYVHAETYVAKTPTAETRAVSAEVKQAMNSDLPGREKPFEITMATKYGLESLW